MVKLLSSGGTYCRLEVRDVVKLLSPRGTWCGKTTVT